MISKIKDNWENITIVLVVCIAFIWGKSCGNKVLEPQESKVIIVTNYRDTIFPKDTIYEDRWHPGKPVHDTAWLPLPQDSIDCNRVFVYDDTLRHKEYEVYSQAHVQGTLRNMKIGVKLKVPLIIKDSTVVKIDSLVYRPYKYEIHAGGIVGFKLLAPTLDLSVDKYTYGIGYDFINKSPVISFKYRLIGWTPKKRKK